MLFVKTIVQTSNINALGLFSRQFIPKDTLIWQFTPGFDRKFTRSQILDLPELTQRYLTKSAWRCNSGLYNFCMDDTKYINHSNNANCGGDIEDTSYSLRDIQQGEELTENYSHFPLDDKNDVLLELMKKFGIVFLGV